MAGYRMTGGTKHEARPSPACGGQPPSDLVLITLIVLADAVLALDFATAVALPTISAAFGVPPGTSQWVISAYSLAFGSFALLGGRLADRVGQARCYVAGCCLSALGMTLSAASPTMAVLIVARGLQGVAAALLLPATLSLLASNFPSGPRQLKVLSIHASAGNISNPVGATLMGLLIAYTGWPGTFLISIPLPVIAAWIALRRLPVQAASGANPMSYRVAPFVVIGLALLAWSLSAILSPQHRGWIPVVALAVSLVLLLLVVAQQRTAAVPFLPLRSLRYPNFLSGLTLAGLFVVSLNGGVILIHMALQNIAHFTPFQSGLVFIPYGFFSLYLGLVASRRLAAPIVARPTLSLILLFLTMISALVLLALPIDAGNALMLYFPALALMAFSAVFASAVIMSEIYKGIPAGEEGMASSMIFMFRMIFLAIGTAVIINASGAIEPATLGLPLNRYGVSFLLAAWPCVCGILIVMLTLHGPRRSGDVATSR